VVSGRGTDNAADASAPLLLAHMKRASAGGMPSPELAAALGQVGPWAPQQRGSDNAVPAELLPRTHECCERLR
jgi:hypothetical protein